jgi:hypothetical protein
MQIFRRQDFNQIWITLRSDEILGALDSSYIQDYFGNQGQITLYHLDTQVRTPIPMEEVIGQDDPTPSIPHDVFTGYVDLNVVPDGNYKVEGLVRDISGNYTILSEIEVPQGSERIIDFELRITDERVVVLFPQSVINMGLIFSTPLPNIVVLLDATMKKSKVLLSRINNVSVLQTSIVKSNVVSASTKKSQIFAANISKQAFFNAGMDYQDG